MTAAVQWLADRSALTLGAAAVAFAAAGLAVYFGVFAARTRVLTPASGGENPIPDTWGWYGPDRFYPLVSRTWQADHRACYVRGQLFDMGVFAPAYGGLFLVLLVWGFRGVGVPAPALTWLALLPVAAVLADEAENVLLVALVSANDPAYRAPVWAAATCSAAKFLFFAAALGAVTTAGWLRLGVAVGWFPPVTSGTGP